jgi:hypothetical protein
LPTDGRILDALGFEILVDLGIGEARVGAEIDARDLVSIAGNDGLQDAIPVLGAADVAGAKREALQIAKTG